MTTLMECVQMDQATIQSFLHYDPATGVFTWKKRTGCSKSDNIFNSLFAGKVAGSKVSTPRSRTSYIGIKFAGKMRKAHRLAFIYMTGSAPEQVDHIDHNGMNNAWSNLRASDSKDNARNLPIQKSNKTKVIGVNWHKAAKKWHVRAVNPDGVRIDLGRYDSFEKAVSVRKAYEVEFKYFDSRDAR